MTGKTSPSPHTDIIRAGRDALASGDLAGARIHALRAVKADPSSEEAWLLLADVASPKIRARYLDYLLRIHPDSQNVRRALEQLAGSSWPHSEQGFSDLPLPEELVGTAAVPSAGLKPRKKNSKKSAPKTKTNKRHGAAAAAGRPRKPPPKGKRGVRWGMWLAAGSCILAFSATAFANIVVYAQEPPVLARIVRFEGTVTPSFTPSFTPTASPSFTPTSTYTFTPSPTNTPRPAPTAAPYIAIPPGTSGERWIDIDISSQRLVAYQGNTPVGTFLVSTGTSRHPTVLGRYRIYIKLRYDNMAGPGYYLPNVPYTMYYYQGYGIHGTYWHNNFGTPMSHGCVNMRTSDAAWLFSWASVGTVVNIHW